MRLAPPGSTHGPVPDATFKPPACTVAVLCVARLLRECLEQIVRAAPDLRLWQPETHGRPSVVLCATASGAGLQTLRRSPLLDPWPHAVLFDLAGRLGPVGAGIHRFLGYLPPNVEEDRLLRCLRRVANGE